MSCYVLLCISLQNFDEVIQKYNFFKDLDIESRIPFICRSVTAFIFDITNYRYKMSVIS